MDDGTMLSRGMFMAPEDVGADSVERGKLHQRLKHRPSGGEVTKTFLDENVILVITIEAARRGETVDEFAKRIGLRQHSIDITQVAVVSPDERSIVVELGEPDYARGNIASINHSFTSKNNSVHGHEYL